MDTIVTVRVVSDQPDDEVDQAMSRGTGWFAEVERVCSRFDPASELYRLGEQVGQPAKPSPLLFEAVSFALEVAAASEGAFDPTIGAAQAGRGFNRNYKTGAAVEWPGIDEAVTYRDIHVDKARRTLTLSKPLLLDLGAVAKGMAVDLAARELARYDSMSIDAGGDLYFRGRNEQGEPWRIGIEHPREATIIARLTVGEGSICTSGDYARRAPDSAEEHHLLDPRTGSSPQDLISCTVVAPTAMVADALSTAAFVAGPVAGRQLLEDQGVDGLLIARDLTQTMTARFQRWIA